MLIVVCSSLLVSVQFVKIAIFPYRETTFAVRGWAVVSRYVWVQVQFRL